MTTETTFDKISISSNLCGWTWAVYFTEGTKKTGFAKTFEEAREQVAKIIKPIKPKTIEEGARE